MEWIIGVSALLIVTYLVFKWLKFTHFKSELMNELGQHGFTYKEADILYTRLSSVVHTMLSDGASARQIANAIAQSVDFSDPSIEQTPGARVNSKAADTPDASKVVIFVANALRIQVCFMSDSSDNFRFSARDPWAIGYIAGFTDAAFQSGGYPLDLQGIAMMCSVFDNLMGEELASDALEVLEELRQQNDDRFAAGMEAGGTEFVQWANDNERVPTGLMLHITSRSTHDTE
jgi:hypothetical protein